MRSVYLLFTTNVRKTAFLLYNTLSLVTYRNTDALKLLFVLLKRLSSLFSVQTSSSVRFSELVSFKLVCFFVARSHLVAEHF